MFFAPSSYISVNEKTGIKWICVHCDLHGVVFRVPNGIQIWIVCGFSTAQFDEIVAKLKINFFFEIMRFKINNFVKQEYSFKENK
ncbi:hypothetical protein BpHYR1_031246 [Brachionus plicatilis]|uniref:Uncharacterized protein n=1 Tax=Brachionus plicatilis TaxID=10195 RepID=A0A3M7RZU3_BRAPC|nr:hypothetical protein BpHYR1_031246 [Brachionus plicatilis]